MIMKFIMGYSQVLNGNMVVFADSYAEAEEKFENGEYEIEEVDDPGELDNRDVKIDWDTDGEDPEELGLPEIVSIPWFVPDDGIADYLSDIYGYCVNSWYNE